MTWETIIGLETHVQLSTQSKIFSGASTRFGAASNTQANAVDLALPGTLPVLNRGAVESAIKFGLAVGATIAPVSIFARKNYFYPDLPKGYQISQFEQPIILGGCLNFMASDGMKTIRLTRAHLEEDAGKSLHEDYHSMTGIDFNRAGIPLLEVVTEPDIRSAQEAVAYAKALHSLVTWLGICDGNMQEGSFRCDANVSVRTVGQTAFGTRCEIKNLNSFRFLEEAIMVEARRQSITLAQGGMIIQQTRLFDPDKKETRAMRSKEDAQDYRYFPDPDLPALVISDTWIEELRQALPELPMVMRERFMRDYALSEYDATVLTQTRTMADYFQAVVTCIGASQAKFAANWLMGEVASLWHRENGIIAQCKVYPEQLGKLLRRIADGTLSNKIAKEVLAAMWAAGDDVDVIIAQKGLMQISDGEQLEAMIDEVLRVHPQFVAQFRAGKEKAFNALVGQVMKASGGRANPGQLTRLLKGKLAST